MVFRVGEGGSRPNTMRARTCRFAELEGFEPFNLWLSGVWDQWDVCGVSGWGGRVPTEHHEGAHVSFRGVGGIRTLQPLVERSLGPVGRMWCFGLGREGPDRTP